MIVSKLTRSTHTGTRLCGRMQANTVQRHADRIVPEAVRGQIAEAATSIIAFSHLQLSCRAWDWCESMLLCLPGFFQTHDCTTSQLCGRNQSNESKHQQTRAAA